MKNVFGYAAISLSHTPPTHSHTEGEIVDHKIYNVQIYNRYRGYQAVISNLAQHQPHDLDSSTGPTKCSTPCNCVPLGYSRTEQTWISSGRVSHPAPRLSPYPPFVHSFDEAEEKIGDAIERTPTPGEPFATAPGTLVSHYHVGCDMVS